MVLNVNGVMIGVTFDEVGVEKIFGYVKPVYEVRLRKHGRKVKFKVFGCCGGDETGLKQMAGCCCSDAWMYIQCGSSEELGRELGYSDPDEYGHVYDLCRKSYDKLHGTLGLTDDEIMKIAVEC